ncbi:MAG: hypothetical protein II473_06230 [Clostridia bacterium]|nr:hypothetical protein [Clostridia bacterium]
MEQNERRPSGINIGSASIIMVFSVLCLTIFAVLTFITANHEYKLADKSAEYVKAYYDADTRAVITEGKIREIIADSGSVSGAAEAVNSADIGVTATIEGDGCRFAYAQKMDENQELQVELLYGDGELVTEKWELVNVADWSADGEIHLWDGDS